MKYPTLYEMESSRKVIDTFGGYNHNLRIGDGEFYDMKNLTSSYYPIMSPRGKRAEYATASNLQGMIGKDTLCYVDGSEIVIGTERVDMGLSTDAADCPKRLVSMGAYIIIFPDKKYINTKDTSDKGDIEFTYKSDGRMVSFTLCNYDGSVEYSVSSVSPTAPTENITDGYGWVDTSETTHVYKQWNEDTATWVSVATTYIKINVGGLQGRIKEGDGITISGIVIEGFEDLNGTMVVQAATANEIVVIGIMDGGAAYQDGADGEITISRLMPNMDFVIESGNRLWGCRYGKNADGETVNEIYASKLGDFKNWHCFAGISTDSYVASLGSDGEFTGAVTYLGRPIFFKENCLHKIYGNYPSDYQIQTTSCRGVQKGSENSLAIVGEVLYYKSKTGVCAYDGSLPTEVSAAFGKETYSSAVAAALGSKYYISMKKSTADEWVLMVYDTLYGLWHKEDDIHVAAFCPCRDMNTDIDELFFAQSGSNVIRTILGTGTNAEKSVKWMAETGTIGTSDPDKKYVSAVSLRMSLDVQSKVYMFIQYDSSGEWEHVANVDGTRLRSFTIPIRPRRCDHFRLKLIGEGNAKLFAITKTLETGSDR